MCKSERLSKSERNKIRQRRKFVRKNGEENRKVVASTSVYVHGELFDIG